MLKQRCIKAGDLFCGKIACRVLSRPLAVDGASLLRRVLLIRPGGIGDAVLLAPAILAIRNKYPESTITLLAEQRNAGVFSLIPEVDHVCLYDKLPQLCQTMRSTQDIVIDTEQWHRLSAIVARLSKAKQLIGYATNERQRLFTHSVAYFQEDYEADSFFHLLAPLGITPSEFIEPPFLKIPDADQRIAQGLLSPLGSKPFIAIFPGASIVERRWGTSKFCQLAQQFNQKDIQVVVVGAREDALTGDEILKGNKGLNLAGRTTLAESAAVIDKSMLLISGDSGILHIGVGLDKSTVSLFGPGIAKKWAPKGESHIVINKNLPCSPCTRFGYTPKCPHNAACMQQITVKEVFLAAMRLQGRCSAEI